MIIAKKELYRELDNIKDKTIIHRIRAMFKKYDLIMECQEYTYTILHYQNKLNIPNDFKFKLIVDNSSRVGTTSLYVGDVKIAISYKYSKENKYTLLDVDGIDNILTGMEMQLEEIHSSAIEYVNEKNNRHNLMIQQELEGLDDNLSKFVNFQKSKGGVK